MGECESVCNGAYRLSYEYMKLYLIVQGQRDITIKVITKVGIWRVEGSMCMLRSSWQKSLHLSPVAVSSTPGAIGYPSRLQPQGAALGILSTWQESQP